MSNEDGPETLREIAARFSRAFYDSASTTWADTRWLGIRTARYPTDLIVLAEILAETKPELVIESGVFEGGGTLFAASVLEALGGQGRVLGVDVDLSAVTEQVRSHRRIELIEGSSTDPTVVSSLLAAARGKRTMVILDSDHDSIHVLEELRRLGPLVSDGSYLIVEDTAANGHPIMTSHGPGPAEALHAFLAEEQRFAPDLRRERFALTTNPGGYLLRLAEGQEAPPELTDDPAARPVLNLTEGPFAHPVTDELASLRRAVASMAERDRLLRVEWDGSLRRIQATSEAGSRQLAAQLAEQSQLLAAKNRELLSAHQRIAALQRGLPRRIASKLRSRLGLDGLRHREVGGRRRPK